MRQAFAERGIVPLKGDWTNQNPEITRFLQQFGRSGVPLYLLYSGRGEPVVLPQILTAASVLDGARQESEPFHSRGGPACVLRSTALTMAASSAISAFRCERATAVGPAAAARPGEPAPAFRAPDIAGKTVGLADYAGKIGRPRMDQ